MANPTTRDSPSLPETKFYIDDVLQEDVKVGWITSRKREDDFGSEQWLAEVFIGRDFERAYATGIKAAEYARGSSDCGRNATVIVTDYDSAIRSFYPYSSMKRAPSNLKSGQSMAEEVRVWSTEEKRETAEARCAENKKVAATQASPVESGTGRAMDRFEDLSGKGE